MGSTVSVRHHELPWHSLELLLRMVAVLMMLLLFLTAHHLLHLHQAHERDISGKEVQYGKLFARGNDGILRYCCWQLLGRL